MTCNKFDNQPDINKRANVNELSGIKSNLKQINKSPNSILLTKKKLLKDYYIIKTKVINNTP